jgi:hypothetical protein
MYATTRLRRHAYTLMSIASIGQLFSFFVWLAYTVAAANPERYTTLVSSHWEAWLIAKHPSGLQAMALFSPYLIAAIWPLSRLRALAKTLYYDQPISMAVAARFKALANSVLLSGVLMAFGPAMVAGSQAGLEDVPFSLGIGSILLYVIALLCLHSMALLVTEASRIAEENRNFI